MRFDCILMLDWSGGADRGARPKADAIWACAWSGQGTSPPTYLRNRAVAEAWIDAYLAEARAAGDRVLVGIDIAFGLPGTAAADLTGSTDPLALWSWLAARQTDTAQGRDRIAVAAEANRALPGDGPFWGVPAPAWSRPGIGPTRPPAPAYPANRHAEDRTRGKSVWQLTGAGSVGSQTLTGLPVLWRLRAAHGARAWPLEDVADAPVVMAEIYTAMVDAPVRAALAADPEAIKDAAQVELMARAFARADLGAMLADVPTEGRTEGWVLGTGHDLTPLPVPPPLTDDCFALPRGTDWVPVDEALTRLRAALGPVTAAREAAPEAGLILAAPAVARADHPPHDNAAVDGYAFAGPLGAGAHALPLVPGRAAAGAPHAGTVPPGHAIRILTGAALPPGVDSVVLQEDCAASATHVAFHGPLKRGANARPRAEDIAVGDVVLPKGHRLRAPDLATLASAGVAGVSAHARLRVAVLSTGDEVGRAVPDANRPMLLSLVAGWGHDARDGGIAPDDASALRAALDAAAACDAIVTTGGASDGDEDHLSRLMRADGHVTAWRIALKPGRPLMLGTWRGTPVFGLPGNPVAAFVCAALFARPALRRLAGGDWAEPLRITVPAAFAKTKRPGRREYLRARLGPQGAERFASEGSGRVTSLSFADGLVELPDGAATIAPGDPVTFLPFADLLS
ncbi:MAG: molybdopterin-binding protein [Paracoccaceae bacterium]